MKQAYIQFVLECHWVLSRKPPCWLLGAREVMKAVARRMQQEVMATAQAASHIAPDDLSLATHRDRRQDTTEIERSRQV